MDQDQEFQAIREMYRLMKPFNARERERIGCYVGHMLQDDEQSSGAETPSPTNTALGRLW